MKKIILYISIVISVFVISIVSFVAITVVHVHLPHGAVLHIFPALRDNQDNGAVILCPGGGYSFLAKWQEGYMWFPFFLQQGFIPAMLEYRMPKQDCHIPMVDGAEAIRMMRQHAKEWHFNENNIGIMGFSAGGHLASSIIVTDVDSIRPNFGILFYPVISMKKELTHMDTHDQLLGVDASTELELQYSNELHISEKTPPVYLAHSSDDLGVSPQNSILFYNGMRAHNRPVMLHIYPSGGHGWGYRLSVEHHRQMLEDLADWLKNRKQK